MENHINEPWALNIQQHVQESDLLEKPLLVCRILKTWQKYGKVSLRTKEGKSFHANGLYDLLDVVCDQFNIPIEDIDLVNNNWTEEHDRYKVSKALFNFEMSFFNKTNQFNGKYSGDKFYGLFIGRADRYRLRALVLKDRITIPKLSSFHHIFDAYPAYEEVGSFLINHCDSLDEFRSIKPHSDIDNKILKQPVSIIYHSLSDVWSKTYSQIGLEIVMETVHNPNSFYITEKTMRPIYYKRPFLLFGAFGFLQRLRDLGFKTFDGKIPNYYENFDRGIDQVFECLIKTHQKYSGDAQKLLDDCADDIQHNYDLLLSMGSKHHEISKAVGGLSYFGTK